MPGLSVFWLHADGCERTVCGAFAIPPAHFLHDFNMCRKNITEGAERLRYSVAGAHMQANENSPLAGR